LLFLAAVIPVLMCSQDVAGQLRGYYPNAGPDLSPEPVSLIQLIANPRQYDGKKVRFIGFLRLEFEGNAAYLHREDYENGITQNAIWVDVPTDMSASQKADTNMHYVICAGTFRAALHGHMDLFSGALSNVYRLQVWPASEHDHAPKSHK
jgi:hypothetical protein